MKDMMLRGVGNGLRTTWTLGKIIVPVTLVVTLLKHTPVIEWIVWLFTPVMGLVGLPGEAAVVVVLGWILNLYAAIGAIFSLGLAVPEIFLISVVLSFSHNLLVESAVAKRMGLSAVIVVGTRIGVGLLSAATLHLVIGNKVGGVSGTYEHLAYLWNMNVMTLLTELLSTIWSAIWQLAVIVIPLMFVIQILKELNVLDKIAYTVHPLLRFFGMSEKAAIPLLAGIWFGLAYGAGVILEATREHPLTKREMYLIITFLVLCHAVVEDTLLFVPLGVNGWYLLGIRLLLAFVLTGLLARIWRVNKNDEPVKPTGVVS
jgi:hypothetical protein